MLVTVTIFPHYYLYFVCTGIDYSGSFVREENSLLWVGLDLNPGPFSAVASPMFRLGELFFPGLFSYRLSLLPDTQNIDCALTKWLQRVQFFFYQMWIRLFKIYEVGNDIFFRLKIMRIIKKANHHTLNFFNRFLLCAWLKGQCHEIF